MVPIVLVQTSTLLPVVVAGAARAGRRPAVSVARDEADVPDLLQRGTDAELVILKVEAPDRLPERVESFVARGGRPIPSLVAHLGSGVDPACVAMLQMLPAGLNVAVPSLEDDGERRRLWDSLRRPGLDERHHLVDVDGHPALAELAAQGPVVEGDVVELLAAGAAGVLGGRMVAGNRRWTVAPED
jgi:hypothetical protein